MTKVVLQPAGSNESHKHYVDTMSNPVPISQISQFLTEEDEKILKKESGDHVRVWGVTKGKNSVNEKKWKKITHGDVCFFSGNRKFISKGVVFHKVHNFLLSKHLWKTKENGETWEFVYFIKDFQDIDIACSSAYPVIYKENHEDNLRNLKPGKKPTYQTWRVQGFNVLDEIKSERFLSWLNQEDEIDLSEEDYEEMVSPYYDKTDEEYVARRRKEQAFLRKKLFNKKDRQKCAICNQVFHKDFLICAHIKKRKDCSKEERMNFSNIAPMCKFGCDELFERGYISVLKKYVFSKTNDSNCTPTVLRYLNDVKGNLCEYYSQESKDFFRWHYREVFRKTNREE